MAYSLYRDLEGVSAQAQHDNRSRPSVSYPDSIGRSISEEAATLFNFANKPLKTLETIPSTSIRVALISSYTPQRCGIATFTEDLVESMRFNHSFDTVHVVAVAENPEEHSYGNEVVCKIRRNDRDSYIKAANFLNRGHYDVICLQHEFGLFGGPEGAYILELLRRLHKPVVTTLHTLLANPEQPYFERMNEIIDASDYLVTLTPCASSILHEVYNASSSRSSVIPHGIPDMEWTDPDTSKGRYGWAGRTVLMTFGLIGPSKGIELMIEAMPAIVREDPNVLYIVAGATHPGVLAHEGEAYRDSLVRRVEELGLQKNVEFVNRYMRDEEVCDYLQACDIYVTPYKNKDQISSGTLSYAFGAGRPVISTPYLYAEDLLCNDRGRLVSFGATDELSAEITKLVRDEVERRSLGQRAYSYARRMTWPVVADGYRSLFQTAAARQPHVISVAFPKTQVVGAPYVYQR